MPKTAKAPRDDTSCALCSATDYRNCDCPWDKAFDEWPNGRKLAKLQKLVEGGSGEE